MKPKKKSVDYVTLSKDIINEHNIVRTNPSSYVQKLQDYLKYFKGDILQRPGNPAIKTYEGKAAFLEAIEALQKQKPVVKLIESEKLNLACIDHLKDIGPKGLCTHDGTDGSNPSDRIEKYCEWDIACSENIDFGSKTAEEVLISLIVDDGIEERNHRKNVFNADLKYIGVASGPHKDFEHCTVLDYVADLRELGHPSKHKVSILDEITKREEEKKNKKNSVKNPYQENDPDAPDNTISMKISKTTKIINGKPAKIVKKTYTLSDKSLHVIEVIES
jgi:uncharacterized protein YkwD